jgi:ribonuclease R
MKERVGEEFDATVSSVTSFGAFATLANTCEGLIPISSLARDYFYDEKNLALRSSSDTINIGDKIRVRLEEADMIKGKLRFSLTGGKDDEG